ncbi:hypothetical protein [Clostridium thermobutyricum]|uniref:hypothetical protein n=1 Tax=Clostridium thermobutyricum TaxID=29372 RepID=UPI003F51D095
MDKNLLEEIKLRLDTNRYELRKLDEKYIKVFAPEGYKKGTSYKDFDTIHGSRKEFNIIDFYNKRERLEKIIKLDEAILFRETNDIDIDKYLKLLINNREKIDYLRNIKGFTIKEISEKLNLSERHVQRVCKKINKKN